MKAIAGVFSSREDAQRAATRLAGIGVDRADMSFLVPGMTEAEVFAATPTTETEGTGMGKAVGAVVGGASGAAIGSFGAAAASLLIPGIGPVAAIGIAAMALFGAGGAVAGAAAGGAVENEVFDGLPIDELFVYEEALRRGRTVVIVLADGDDDATKIREAIASEGAVSVDAARDEWWIDVRADEAASYKAIGDFDVDETHYRRGFERAHRADLRDRPFDEARTDLSQSDADMIDHAAYRHGYERGRARSAKIRSVGTDG
ncbi:MAG: hypothetical protein H7X80_05785 [bacterium]|nr:hypothetical protein [Candidatus Kapabacteria bacterium]